MNAPCCLQSRSIDLRSGRALRNSNKLQREPYVYGLPHRSVCVFSPLCPPGARFYLFFHVDFIYFLAHRQPLRRVRPESACECERLAVAIWALFSDYGCIAPVYAEIGILSTSSDADRNIEAASAPVLTASNCFARKAAEQRGEWLRRSRYNGILNLYFPLRPSSLKRSPCAARRWHPNRADGNQKRKHKSKPFQRRLPDAGAREGAKMKTRTAEGRSCVRRDRSVCVGCSRTRVMDVRCERTHRFVKVPASLAVHSGFGSLVYWSGSEAPPLRSHSRRPSPQPTAGRTSLGSAFIASLYVERFYASHAFTEAHTVFKCEFVTISGRPSALAQCLRTVKIMTIIKITITVRRHCGRTGRPTAEHTETHQRHNARSSFFIQPERPHPRSTVRPAIYSAI